MSRLVGYALAGAALSGACVRDPIEGICPAVGEGDLRVSELRGEQSDDEEEPDSDDRFEWLEIENLTGADVDLQGLVVDVLAIDGGTHLRMNIRTSVTVAPGARVVLGSFPTTEAPDFVDYTFGIAWREDLPVSGAVTLLACGAQIDRAVYDGLPSTGTFTRTPESWCADPAPGDDGLPGTPGAENTPCP